MKMGVKQKDGVFYGKTCRTLLRLNYKASKYRKNKIVHYACLFAQASSTRFSSCLLIPAGQSLAASPLNQCNVSAIVVLIGRNLNPFASASATLSIGIQN